MTLTTLWMTQIRIARHLLFLGKRTTTIQQQQYNNNTTTTKQQTQDHETTRRCYATRRLKIPSRGLGLK